MSEEMNTEEMPIKKPGKKGRPRKADSKKTVAKKTNTEETPVKKPGKKGRPRKADSNKTTANKTNTEQTPVKKPGKKGRPRKADSKKTNTEGTPIKKPGKKGRPRKADSNKMTANKTVKTPVVEQEVTPKVDTTPEVITPQVTDNAKSNKMKFVWIAVAVLVLIWLVK